MANGIVANESKLSGGRTGQSPLEFLSDHQIRASDMNLSIHATPALQSGGFAVQIFHQLDPAD